MFLKPFLVCSTRQLLTRSYGRQSNVKQLAPRYNVVNSGFRFDTAAPDRLSVPELPSLMQSFGEFATDCFISHRPELASHRRAVADAAFCYLFRFDNNLSNDFIRDIISSFSRFLADLVGWSEAESRRVSLRVFHDASRRYFATSWGDAEVFARANSEALHALRRRHARRFDIIKNGLGPNEDAVRQVDSISLDDMLLRARKDAPVVVKIYADYCSTCAAMAPDFEAAARALYPATFVSLDGPSNLDAAHRLGVHRYPSILKFVEPSKPVDTYMKRSYSEQDFVAFASVSALAVDSPVQVREEGNSEGELVAGDLPLSPVDEALALAAECDPDPAGGQFGQWARMLKNQGIDQLENLVADRDAAMHIESENALACDEECAVSYDGLPGDLSSGDRPVVILLGGGMGSG